MLELILLHFASLIDGEYVGNATQTVPNGPRK